MGIANIGQGVRPATAPATAPPTAVAALQNTYRAANAPMAGPMNIASVPTTTRSSGGNSAATEQFFKGSNLQETQVKSNKEAINEAYRFTENERKQLEQSKETRASLAAQGLEYITRDEIDQLRLPPPNQARLRQGALSWGLFRDTEAPGRRRAELLEVVGLGEGQHRPAEIDLLALVIDDRQTGAVPIPHGCFVNSIVHALPHADVRALGRYQ